MINKKALTIDEISKLIYTQTQNKLMFYSEVAKHLVAFDNEIYHIRKGKISYQPTLIKNLIAITEEIGNKEFITHLIALADKEFKLETKLKLKHENTKVVSYFCTLSSNLPQLTLTEKECVVICFEDANTDNTQDTTRMLCNIKSKIKQELNREQQISLNNNQLIDVSNNLIHKKEELTIAVLFEIKSIVISATNKEFKLRNVTKVKEDESSLTNYLVNNLVQSDLDTEEEGKGIYLLKNCVQTNPNFLRTHVNLVSKDNNNIKCNIVCGTIQFYVNNYNLILITIRENNISYAIKEVEEHGYSFTTIFKENYAYNQTSVENLYTEILTIYKKAEIVLSL